MVVVVNGMDYIRSRLLVISIQHDVINKNPRRYGGMGLVWYRWVVLDSCH